MKRLFATTLSALLMAQAWAAPSRMRPVTLTAPDGAAVLVVAVGDEHSHRYVDALSGEPVQWLPAVERAKSTPAMRARAKDQQKATSFPTRGDLPFLVVLVEFKNKAFSVADPAEYFDAHLNATGFARDGATGCVAEYYRDCSDELFRPVFDVYGPVTMSHDYAYYGSTSSSDANATRMVVEAVQALDGEVDFSRYDIDGDGYVDNVYFYYAGLGQADGGDSNTIWPHSWDLESNSITLTADGVTVNSYACSPELDGSHKPNGIGTFCHEFAHVLGLPDLYASAYSGALHPADWSLMASGNYLNDGRTPPALSAYERLELGWIEPKTLSYPLTVELPPLAVPDPDGDADFRVCRIDTERQNEYFLLENRQRTGWDTYLPGHGMLVWHIDYNPNIWDRNVVNNTPSHQYVDIVEANNATSHTQDAGFPFPGTARKTELTSTTSPALRSWSGQAIDVPITAITESGSAITFRALGGKTPVGRVTGARLTDEGPDFLTLAWDAAEAAEGYRVYVDSELALTCAQPAASITGLEPDTPYDITIEGYDAYESGRAMTITARTAKATFPFLSPAGLEVTGIGATSASIAWHPMDEAVEYIVELSRVVTDKETSTSHGFDGRALPQGWTAAGQSWYSVAGYYGAAAPALSLSFPGGTVSTGTLAEPVVSISLFARASAMEDARLVVTTPQETATSAPVSKQGGILAVDLTEPTLGPIRISLTPADGTGRVVIDDVTLVTRVTSLQHCASARVSGTAHEATELLPGTAYSVTVAGVDNAGTASRPCEPAVFTTGSPSGIADINADDTPARYFDLQGIPVTTPIRGGIYIRVKGTQATKVTIR